MATTYGEGVIIQAQNSSVSANSHFHPKGKCGGIPDHCQFAMDATASPSPLRRRPALDILVDRAHASAASEPGSEPVRARRDGTAKGQPWKMMVTVDSFMAEVDVLSGEIMEGWAGETKGSKQ